MIGIQFIITEKTNVLYTMNNITRPSGNIITLFNIVLSNNYNTSFFNDYEVVEHIGFDQNYGDVFKAYTKRENKNFFTILFIDLII